MGCATGVIKNLVFLLNFLCSIVGLTLIVLGSIVFVGINKIDAATKQNNTVLPAFILTLGVLIFIISFLGCCGVCQRSQCMLSTYAAILILFFVAQLALGIYGYIEASKSDTNVRKEFENQLESTFQNINKNDGAKSFFNEFQKELKCCGAKGPQDYEDLNHQRIYPSSCCGVDEGKVCTSPYPDGCSDKIFDLLLHGLKVISYVALGICVTEIVAALFAICLVNSYRNESRRGM